MPTRLFFNSAEAFSSSRRGVFLTFLGPFFAPAEAFFRPRSPLDSASTYLHSFNTISTLV